jgi:hypothetical protein
MALRAFLFFLLIAIAKADICIGPSATGDGSGSDWNNIKLRPTGTAWLRGPTYYAKVATYSRFTIDTPTSGTNLITIKKATILDHGPSTGWNDAYGTGQVEFPIGNDTGYAIQISVGYIVIDGQEYTPNSTTGFGVDGSYGIKISNGTVARNTDTIGVYYTYTGAAAPEKIEFRNVEFPFNNGTTADDSGMQMFAGFFDGLNNSTWTHVKFHGGAGQGVTIRQGNGAAEFYGSYGSHNLVWNDVEFENIGGGGGNLHHWALAWMTGIDGFTWNGGGIHNTFRGIPPNNGQSGVFFVGKINNGLMVNVRIWWTPGATQDGQPVYIGDEGIVYTLNTQPYQNTTFRMLNCTVVNPPGLAKFAFASSNPAGTGCEFANNIVYGSSPNQFETRSDGTTIGSASYNIHHNAWGGPSGVGTGADGTGFMSNLGTSVQDGFASSGWVDYANGNFHLAAATITGDNTYSAPITIDPDGLTRGVDGVSTAERMSSWCARMRSTATARQRMRRAR